jgi:hypothetical protein
MKIILTEEQLKKIEESTRVGLNEARMPTYLEKRMLRSHARDIQNEFYAEYLLITKSLYKFNQLAELIHQKQYGPKNTWEDDNQKRKMAVIYNELMGRLDDFGNKYLVNYNEENTESVDDMDEQIDTDDEEKELMALWHDDEDDEDESDFSDGPDYDTDSEDSYDMSKSKDIENRMKRSIRVGDAGRSNQETKRYFIDGKEYYLTPIEYRHKLNDMGRITPEKAATMGVSVDSSGIIRKNDDATAQKIKSLRNKIIATRNDIKRDEEEYIRHPYAKIEQKIDYLRTKLEYYLDEYDELMGNVNGEEYDF